MNMDGVRWLFASSSSPVDLLDLLSQYVLEHDLQPGSIKQLDIAVRKFSRHIGRAAQVADLERSTVNGWLLAMQNAGLARETVRSKRRALLTLWRQAFDDDLLDEQPRRIRIIRPADTIPECWTHEQLGALLTECADLTGCFRKLNLPRAPYMTSLINAKYDTGLRLGDMQSIEEDWIWPSGGMSIVQHKTGKVHRVQMRPETIVQIKDLMRMLPGRRLIWPAFCGRRRFFRFFKQIVVRAGLRGSSKWIRRSGASYSEREHPGEGWRYLGHAAPGLDRRSYLDPKIAYPAPQLPPRIA